jgi:hypothetical protein
MVGEVRRGDRFERVKQDELAAELPDERRRIAQRRSGGVRKIQRDEDYLGLGQSRVPPFGRRRPFRRSAS